MGGSDRRDVRLQPPIPGLMLFIDTVDNLNSFGLQDTRRARQVKIAAHITSAYAKLIPWMATPDVLGLLLATFFRKRFPLPIPLLAMGLSSAAAVVMLIVVMAYITATSFDVANVLYTSPASPFLVTFTTLGLDAWYMAVKQWALCDAK
jgi:hypothetical protein